MALTQYKANDALDNTVQLTNSDDPAEGGGATLEDVRALLDALDDALQSVGTDEVRVDLQSESADLATQTTLSSVRSALQGSLDVSAATVTATDDGNFNVTLDAQSAGLAQDSSVQNLASYSGDVNTLNMSNAPHTVNADAFMVPDGSNAVQDVQITTPNSTQRTITVPTNAIIPQQVTSFDGGGTASTVTVFNQ